MKILFGVLILALNFYILWNWSKRLKTKGKKLAWYWGWILPTDLIILSLYTIIGLFLIGLFIFKTFPINQRTTKEEMQEITQSLLKYKNDTGRFPENMEELIGSRPLRKNWRQDSWNTEYVLVRNSNNVVNLVSAGADKSFETADDIKISLQ